MMGPFIKFQIFDCLPLTSWRRQSCFNEWQKYQVSTLANSCTFCLICAH